VLLCVPSGGELKEIDEPILGVANSPAPAISRILAPVSHSHPRVAPRLKLFVSRAAQSRVLSSPSVHRLRTARLPSRLRLASLRSGSPDWSRSGAQTPARASELCYRTVPTTICLHSRPATSHPSNQLSPCVHHGFHSAIIPGWWLRLVAVFGRSRPPSLLGLTLACVTLPSASPQEGCLIFLLAAARRRSFNFSFFFFSPVNTVHKL
jgi:hypothetical protein